MTTAPQPGSGENEPKNEALEDGLRNLVNEAFTLPSNAQIPTNKQPLNGDIMIKAVREVAMKSKTTPGKAFAGICCTLQAGGNKQRKTF